LSAIHGKRAGIRDIFRREMADVDPALSNDPAALAEAARGGPQQAWPALLALAKRGKRTFAVSR